MLAGLMKQQVQKLWQDPDTFATPLLLSYIDLMPASEEEDGETKRIECLEWSPATVELELTDTLGLFPAEINFDKLMAAIMVVTTDRFRKSLPDFINICNVLSGTPFDPSEFDPADPLECAWGIAEAALLSPPEDDKTGDFCADVTEYIKAAIGAAGLTRAPAVLKSLVPTAADSAGVYNQYGDDPDMFKMINDTETAKLSDIESELSARFSQLTEQLEALPLEEGSTAAVVYKLKQIGQPPKK